MKIQENHLITFAGTLVALGIIFGTDRLIGYSFIGAGVLLSLLSLVQSNKAYKNSLGRRIVNHRGEAI